jgi:hypothetical protein
MSGDAVEFVPDDIFTITGRGKVYSGPCPVGLAGLNSERVKGCTIIVGGKVLKIVGVERFVMMHERPLRAGESVGFLAVPTDPTP